MAEVERQLFLDEFSIAGPLQPPWVSNPGAPMPEALGGDAGYTGVSDQAFAYYSSAVPSDCWLDFDVTVPIPADYDGLWYYFGAFVRCNSDGSSGLLLAAYADRLTIYDVTNDGDVVGEVYPTWEAGDKFRAEVRGSTLKIFQNANEIYSAVHTTMPGQGGIAMYHRRTGADKNPGRVDNWRIGDWTTTNLSITGVNAGDVVTGGDDIYVTGTQLDTATSFTMKQAGLSDVDLPIQSASDTQAVVGPFDVRPNDYPYGAGSSIEITDGAVADSLAVTLAVRDGGDYTVGASVDTSTGLAKVGGSNGDQWHYETTVVTSGLLVQDDTNFVLDAPVPDDTSFLYNRYSSNVWDTGTVWINKDEGGPPPGGDVPADWATTITTPSLTVGVPSSGEVHSHATGTPPITFGEILQQTPDELITRSDGTWSGLVPTGTPFQMQWKVSNNANVDGENSNLLDISPVMPTITDPRDRASTSSGAEITVTTPSQVGKIYWVADPSSAQPSGEQIAGGLNQAGNAAELSGSWTITSSGEQAWRTVTGGRSGVKYYYWMVQVN